MSNWHGATFKEEIPTPPLYLHLPVHPGEGSSSVLSSRVLTFFPREGLMGVVPDLMWGQRSGMSICTDCKAIWNIFLICEIGLYKINWIENLIPEFYKEAFFKEQVMGQQLSEQYLISIVERMLYECVWPLYLQKVCQTCRWPLVKQNDSITYFSSKFCLFVLCFNFRVHWEIKLCTFKVKLEKFRFSKTFDR